MFNSFGMEISGEDERGLRSAAKVCVELGRTLTCVEIGSWVGRSALVFADYFSKVFCVDLWDLCETDDWPCNDRSSIDDKKISRSFEIFCNNVGEHLYRDIFPLRGYSWTFARSWPARSLSIDLLFIDADHLYDSVREDLLNWRPYVNPYGVIVFHDYGTYEGVTRVVDEFFPTRQVIGSVVFASNSS
jgi:hypothetical protein